MKEEQDNLALNFPRLIDALRSHKLGPDGGGDPCTPQDTRGCRIPNVRIGVASTDLGVGQFASGKCSDGGDGGRLQSDPRGIPGCPTPADPYISYTAGETNVQDPSGQLSPIDRVKQSFSCIARLGKEGCGYERTLEAARRALDPALQINPSFLRKDAFLAVVFITDEDDCSAQNLQLFDTSQISPDSFLGPPNFRCFDFGITCDINDRNRPGPRKNCKPMDDPDPSKHWLSQVQDYVDFFRGLKPPGRVILSAIAGPPDAVAVGLNAGEPTLLPSCKTAQGDAAPAIRIKSLVDAFGNRGHFSSICTDDFGPALERLGQLIVTSLGGQCIDSPPLTPSGGIACHGGDLLGTAVSGEPVSCQTGCLHQAECIVDLVTAQGTPQQQSVPVPQCGPAKFENPEDKDCGAICPCWRIVSRPGECKPEVNGSPYGLEILRQGKPEPGSMAVAHCATAPEPWGSETFVARSQCR
jgi:hypothetical protein